MMKAFDKADNHPAYGDSANAYEQHEQPRKKLSAIESKR